MTIRPRYEFKYVALHEDARTLLAHLSDTARYDANARDGGYHVNSIYFDTDDFALYYEKIDGVDPRYKVRIRYYGEITDATDLSATRAFIEIKHRRNQLIAKDRVSIRAEAIHRLLEHTPLRLEESDLLGRNDPPTVDIVRRYILNRPLSAFCTVSYYRRPMVFPGDSSLRVTVDGNLRAVGTPCNPWVLPEDGNRFLPPHLCVVEAKFHWAMPLFLLQIFQQSGLKMRPYSKYCSAMECVYPNLLERELRFESAV